MEAEREREASELDPQALINQYAKQKLGRSIAKVCRGARKRFGNNARFAFWHATAPLFEGAVQESLRELQQLDGTSTLQLAVVAAQLYAHSCEAHADQEAVSSLEQRFDNLEASASTDDLTTTAAFYYLCTNDPFKARLVPMSIACSKKTIIWLKFMYRILLLRRFTWQSVLLTTMLMNKLLKPGLCLVGSQ